MDKFTIVYILTLSLAFLGWSSFKIFKAFGKRAAVIWAISIIVWFVIIAVIVTLLMKLIIQY